MFHAARNGARKINTSPPRHPTQMVAPWHRTTRILDGAWKHATGAASSFGSPPLGGSAVMSSMSSSPDRACRLVLCLVSSTSSAEPATFSRRTCVPDATSQKQTCATHPCQPFLYHTRNRCTHAARNRPRPRATHRAVAFAPADGLRAVVAELHLRHIVRVPRQGALRVDL